MPVTGLAIVLLVIIILIGIILFRPIVYSFEVVARKPYKVEIYIEWWGKMFLVHFKYEQGTPFFQEVYILRKAKLGAVRDYEDWLARRVEEETADADDEVEESYETLNDRLPNAGVATDLEPPRPLTEEELAKSEEIAKSADTVAEEAIGSVRFDKDGTICEEDAKRIAEGKAKEEAEDAAKAEQTSTDETAGDTTKEDNQKAEKTTDPHKRWWLKHVTNGALYEKLLLLMKRSYNHSKPRELRIEGEFGNGDPYNMGLIAAGLYSIWPSKMSEVELNYTERVFVGSFLMKGRIYPGVMAWYGALFALSKPMRDLTVDVIKAGLRYRKQKKAAEKAAATNASHKVAEKSA